MAVIIKRVGYVWSQNQSSGGGVASRYIKSFNVADYSLVGSDYTLTVPFDTHQISTNPQVVVYLDNGTTYEEVIVPVSINSSGDISIFVSSSPDNRFKGKLTIL